MALPTTYHSFGRCNSVGLDRSPIAEGDDIATLAPNERDLARLADAGERGELTAIFNRRAGGIIGYAVNGDGDALVKAAKDAPELRSDAAKAHDDLTSAASLLVKLEREVFRALELTGDAHPRDARELLADMLYDLQRELDSALIYTNGEV